MILDEPIQNEQYGIGFKKGNDKLKDLVWDEVKKLDESGEVDKLADKYELDKSMLCIQESGDTWNCVCLISVMRGTPLMLQLMVVYFGPYFILGIRISMGYSLIAVFIAFAVLTMLLILRRFTRRNRIYFSGTV